MNSRLFSLALASLLVANSALAQFSSSALYATLTAETSQQSQDQKKEEPKKEEPKKDERTPEQKKYDELIKKAKTDDGVFKVHRVDDKIYFEIPEDKLGREFLWQGEVSEAPKAITYVGTAAGTRVIRFAKRDKKIDIRNVDHSTRVEGDDKGLKTGIVANTPEPILLSYDIYAEGPNKSAVIDVTSFYTSNPQDFSVSSAIGPGAAPDPSKTFIQRVKAFPKNIEARTYMTFRRAGGGRTGLAALFGGSGDYNASTIATVVHYSLVELPEKPMLGRLKDSRIGYFTTPFTLFGSPQRFSKTVEYINRFRLEKKDPSAAISEPKEPIVFYLAREVPDKWRKYLKAGIEDWQPAFEKAGFKNAIICKDAPSIEEDPNWDAEDARYSVIRWAPSEVQNAMGPSIQDPRSGETISAHVIFWNDIVRTVEEWYFAQSAAADKTVQKLPMSDEMIGRMVQYVACHEVGHTLGLEHNFKASVAFTIKDLRSKSFTDKFGPTSSIMSYGRNNYVAQPGDGVKNFMPRLGPYDFFAIEYGYKQLGLTSPEAEKPALDALLSKQVSDRTVRFGNYKYSGIDPTTQSENIGDDTVEATRLGLMNLEYIAKNVLIPATSKVGESYDDLANYHNALVGQWLTEIMHTMQVVAGVEELDTHHGRGSGQIFKPMPKSMQKRAVALLLSKGARPSKEMVNPRIITKITPGSGLSLLNQLQSLVLNGLFNESRLRRLSDSEANGQDNYRISEVVDDVVGGVFAELNGGKVSVDVYGRQLHRNFVKVADTRLNGGSATQTDLKPLLKSSLRTLAKRLDAASGKAADRVTAAHLQEVRSDIQKVLEDKYSKPSASAPSFSLADLLGGIYDLDADQGACWARALPMALREILNDMEGKPSQVGQKPARKR